MSLLGVMAEEGKNDYGKSYFIVINLVRALLVLAFIGAYFNERWLVFFISGFALLVTFLPRLLRKRWGITIPAEFEIMIILFIYGSLFFGEVRGFYARFWWWSIFLSFISSIALGLVGLTILYALYKEEKIDASPVIIALFAFSFSVAMGSLWQVFEFSMDYFFGFRLQSYSSNTIIDLIVNTIGAFVVSIGGYYYIKSGRKNLISSLVGSFVKVNPNLFRSEERVSPSERIKELIRNGEGDKMEFKSTLRTNLHTNQIDKKIEHSVLKTIVAYLNSDGGQLLIGVSDNGQIMGIEKDGFSDRDRLNLHFTNLIKVHIGNEYLPFIKTELVRVDDLNVLRVDCLSSDKAVFLKLGREEEFYVRNGPSSVRLNGRELLDYVGHKFGHGEFKDG